MCSNVAAEPPTDQGLIDGHPALAMWPALQEDPRSPSDPTGFTVHLVPYRDRQNELIRPAGKWFLLDDPSFDFYRWYLEAPGMISTTQSTVAWALMNGGNGQRILSHVVPAGLVVLDPNIPIGPRQSIRLYALGSRFFRPVRLSDWSTPIQMPPGPVLGLLHDDERSEWVALARAVEAHPKAPGIVTLRSPTAESADLLVLVDVRGVALDEAGKKITGVLTIAGTPRPADLLAHDPTCIYAAWWNVQAKEGIFRVGVSGLMPFEREVEFSRGHLHVVEGGITLGRDEPPPGWLQSLDQKLVQRPQP